MGLLASTLRWSSVLAKKAVERATTVIGCDVNKPVKSSLHSEKVNIGKSYRVFFNITQYNNNWKKKKLQHFFNNMVFTRKKSTVSRCKQTSKLKWGQKSKSQFVTKLKNSNCEEKNHNFFLQHSKLGQHSDTQRD